MGNSNSATLNSTQPPPPWTQSLPRDAHRRKKHQVAPPGMKVLPERVPGQRLRPTENGRNLQAQGTISHRKLIESVSVPNGYHPGLSSQHSTSMTALNFNGHPEHNYQPQSPHVKFGYSKMSFTSEPDLRDVPQSLPVYPSANMPQTMISESPTKGKIISKKRHKAPPPPPFEGPDYNTEVHFSSPSPLPKEATASPKHDSKAKQKKGGLFKKKSDSRAKKSSKEIDSRPLRLDRIRMTPIERVVMPSDTNPSKSNELRHRARSLDNLQHEVTRERTTSQSHLQIETAPPSNRSEDRFQIGGGRSEREVLEKPAQVLKEEMKVSELREKDERVLARRLSSPFPDSKPQSLPSFEYGRSPGEKQINYEIKMAQAETEWDNAEKEWVEKKQKSDNLQREIMQAAMNLRKTPVSPERDIKNSPIDNTLESQAIEEAIISTSKESPTKTFFFGMDPDNSSKLESPGINDRESSNVTKANITTEKTQEEKRSKLQEHNARTTRASADLKDGIFQEKDPRHMTKRIDEFAATIERSKSKLKPNPDEYTNSLSRRGDGGYHSRQNSGSLPQETENSGEEDSITMNLRPIIPRRQLDLPRFSPNAAWRSLGTESSSRSKESYIEGTITEEIFTMNEDKMHTNSHPTVLSRGSGEKSADSGISGDAGSPGLTREFESLSPKKIKHSAGIPLSSPLEQPHIEQKRAWTPAQDLDDHSFDESGDIVGSSPLPQEVSTFPRLTSRTNMFAEEGFENMNEDHRHISSSEKDMHSSTRNEPQSRVDRQNQDSSSSRRNITHNAVSIEQKAIESAWRENWSLSRSIPNSLNNCDEPDRTSNRSRSESRMSAKATNEARPSSSAARPTTPSYLQHGNSGHIMYLPEYKAYQVPKKNSDGSDQPTGKYDDNHSPMDEMEINADRTGKYETYEFEGGVPGYPSKDPRFLGLGDKKKKFAYKSTIRIVEKKKLEEKLSIEVHEKEERRLKEIDAMLKVEQEFQSKREREKEKLKKQLKLYQGSSVDGKDIDEQYYSDSTPRRPESISTPPIRYTGTPNGAISPHFHHRRELSSYQSLPPDHILQNPESLSHNDHVASNQGLFSGIKKWVKGKKDTKPSGGYISDGSSTTITSRQDPDGAPASTKKANGNFREEIIAAARSRNGSDSNSPGSESHTHRSPKTMSEASSEVRSNRSFETSDHRPRLAHRDLHVMSPHYLPHHRRSPGTSESSKRSPMRSYTPDSRRTMSPDSGRSQLSDPYPLTHELPESRQEIRQYKEYRQSTRKHQPVIMGPVRAVHPDLHGGDNYRRNFVCGQMQNYPSRGYQEEMDMHSRHSNDSRRSKRSLMEHRRSPRELAEYETRSLQRRPSSQQRTTVHCMPSQHPTRAHF